ncbi:MAG TPA: ImmA/IrrE family metallo-endopeptidase [Candidatus Dormibacteraeota bacterium]
MSAAEQLARDERARLGLGDEAPVADLVRVLERDGGVCIALCHLGEQGLAGLYQTREGVPVIMINSSPHPVRVRFTIAHEYGHHRLGHGVAVDRVIDTSSRDRREVGANQFAAELLLPGVGLDRWLRSRGDAQPDLETVARLANHYGVSCEVALHRLERLRRVRPAVRRALQARIEAGEHRDLAWQLGLSELEDTVTEERRLGVRLPAVTRRAVLRAVEDGLIDGETAAERLHVDRLEVQRMRRHGRAID